MPSIDCAKIKNGIVSELLRLPRPERFLAGIVAQQDSAGLSFQKIKQAAARNLGLTYQIHELPTNSNTSEAIELVRTISNDNSCGGIVVQLPLPPDINTDELLNSIPPHLDPDRLSATSHLPPHNEILSPATQTTLDILSLLQRNPLQEKICVVGLGRLVGGPIARYFSNYGAQNLITLQKGDDLSPIQDANIIILGTGAPALIRAENLTLGAVVIDFGYGKDEQGVLRGDFLPSAQRSDIFYTPTPGGTGPLLVSNLLKNFYLLQNRTD